MINNLSVSLPFCLQVNVNPEDLIPKLPKPKDLQPFPTTQSMVHTHTHTRTHTRTHTQQTDWSVLPNTVCSSVFVLSLRVCVCVQVYRGHTGLVRSISVSPSGQWLASGNEQCVCVRVCICSVYLLCVVYAGSDDGSVRFWEVCSSRCWNTVQVGGAVKSIAWNPNPSVCLLAVAL